MASAFYPPGLSLMAAVRAHLGISIRQLARYLGVSMGFVTHIEAGRKGVPPALLPRLLRLAQLLPAPWGQGPPAPPPPPAPYDPLLPLPAPTSAQVPEPLRQRLRDVRLRLLVVGRELARQQVLAAALAHRHAGLQLLHTAAAPPEPAEADHFAHWLHELALDLARDEPNPAATATTRHLLAARVAGLRAEAAALAEINTLT
ncbi:helix-turn-helix domain-containing protein [Hymenobacter cellulosivorans]|uniref:Helix-turn-helix domain-containing protein n=1 Tax=Hymenobacter cellulosivorans TaxID=2932249 RepID=A0ABY4FDJ3_9BACT|nr:helix-turn-helix transcriptional regulator [Hymenobacter cellulosivorans]UOQ54470.1 helix-turn-helix domain-containing protein [Hymenobacter cellulosivorans]